jgi:hypothetical protein
MLLRALEACAGLTAAAVVGCIVLLLVALGLAVVITCSAAFAFFVALGHIIGDVERSTD